MRFCFSHDSELTHENVVCEDLRRSAVSETQTSPSDNNSHGQSPWDHMISSFLMWTHCCDMIGWLDSCMNGSGISQEKWKPWPPGSITGRSGSSKSSGFILCGPWISIQNGPNSFYSYNRCLETWNQTNPTSSIISQFSLFSIWNAKQLQTRNFFG